MFGLFWMFLVKVLCVLAIYAIFHELVLVRALGIKGAPAKGK